jgi:hypothetical protein
MLTPSRAHGAPVTTVDSAAERSTTSMSARDSASDETRGIADQTVRRPTSCLMMASSLSRDSSVLAIGSVSTALRRGVNGFLSSCDIRGEMLDRVDAVVERLRHVAQLWKDGRFLGRSGKSGISWRDFTRAARALSLSGQRIGSVMYW